MELHGIHHLFAATDWWALDVCSFQHAWCVIFERHASLRLRFLDNGSCCVLRELKPSIQVFDLRSASPAEASAHLCELWKHWAHSDPPGPPYTRHFVTLLPDGRQRVHEYFSGLNLDFASFSRIKQEVFALYCNPETSLPATPVFSFRDYVLAERNVRQSERGAASLAWWHEQLHSFLEQRCHEKLYITVY